LVLPDYAGFGSALQMTGKHKQEVHRALKIKRAGNRIVTAIGGRDIHPLTAVVGGFSRIPTEEDLQSLKDELIGIEEDARKTVELFSGLSFPDFEHKSVYMALHGKTLLGEKIGFLRNGKIEQYPHDYEQYIKEFLQHDSTAEYVVVEGKGYFVGAQARMNVNSHSRDLRDELKLLLPSHSPFANITFQGIEILSSVRRGIEILDELLVSSIKDESPRPVNPRPSTGIGVVEAPRGLLFHKYGFDEQGHCTYANVTTPTSQNLRFMEDCLKSFVGDHLHLPKDDLTKGIEKLIRAFDPCISCSAH
jgi:coenzyme F420-reducing hydrogenase alpha subunit